MLSEQWGPWHSIPCDHECSEILAQHQCWHDENLTFHLPHTAPQPLQHPAARQTAMIISTLPLKNHWAGLGDTNLQLEILREPFFLYCTQTSGMSGPPKLKLSHEATILQAGPQRKKSKGTSCTSACSSDLLKLRHFPVINSVLGEPG